MRSFLLGLLILFFPATLFAQATGGVEVIGFGNFYRPDCWTPMLVRLTPTTSANQTLLLQVVQDDLDGDQVVFSRVVNLTGKLEGQSTREDRFWMYFIPEPTNGGLPNAAQSASSIKLLQERLRVRLARVDGTPLMTIPELPLPTDIDVDTQRGGWYSQRGCKLIVCVSAGTSQPRWDEYLKQEVVGGTERMQFTRISPRELPENVLGYDAVDAILWLDAPPPDPSIPAEEPVSRALQEYVRRGGRLVICQTEAWQETYAWGDLLPVEPKGVDDVTTLDVLTRWAKPRNGPSAGAPVRGNFKLGRAIAKSGTIAEEWIAAPAGSDAPATPYIVRGPYGLGSVTWVAQNLGDPNITTRLRDGWPWVWDRVLDLKQEATLLTKQSTDREKNSYAPANGAADLGRSLTHLDLTARSSLLLTLAVLFFVAYWLIAGVGSHAYLMNRKKTTMSWFVFAATALAATLFTVVVVRLVVRGSPELKHVTIVRIAPNQPAVVESRIGLYIPQDGPQDITLPNAAPGSVSAITAYARHPAHAQDGQASYISRNEYTIPIRDSTSIEPLTISMPYRSTLKKLQARWVGKLDMPIEGAVSLADEKWNMQGRLTNRTGVQLSNVYIAYKVRFGEQIQDILAWVPHWKPDDTLDFVSILDEKNLFDAEKVAIDHTRVLWRAMGISGGQSEWERAWYRNFRSAIPNESMGDDFGASIPRFAPLLSFYDRLTTQKNEGDQNTRFELLRRGARRWDMSQAISAGQLVIVAQTTGEMPVPLEVNGDRVAGKGVTYWQFVLPVAGRNAHQPPSTQPAGSN